LATSLGSARQYQAEQSKSERGQRVDDVPRPFSLLQCCVITIFNDIPTAEPIG
jgi:hypothetical protein